jgi:hypothetical protein
VSNRSSIIDRSLNRAELRWKWLRLLQNSCTLGCILCLAALAFGMAVLLRGAVSQAAAAVFFVCLAVFGFLAWFIMAMSVLAQVPERRRLAAALERVEPHMMDRLNTLIALEKRQGRGTPGKPAGAELRAPGGRAEDCAPFQKAFADRIGKQAEEVLAHPPPAPPFASARPLAHCLAFLVALVVVALFYELYLPWNKLTPTGRPKAAPVAEAPLDLALPTNSVEQQQAWGEVRITDPGTDLKVTKVDVVPLQIEAAANQALKDVSWYSAINGAAEVAHALPAPSEPRYAVYQPTLYLDELHLSDWDVMTYYAKANTEKSNSFASEIYFVEVRPFREDILKMPGGEKGSPYQCLNEMSVLVERQQHVIRQTHEHAQNPPPQPNVRNQDRQKLSDAESDLGQSAQHLYAKMASEMENKPVGAALDNLAKARKSLEQASRLLADNSLPEAQNHERSALEELVAARKIFQKAVSDNPGDFNPAPDQDRAPVAEPARKLGEIAEFRDEAKAAREFVEKAVERQKNLDDLAHLSPRSAYPGLGEQEQQLQKSVEDFQAQHAQVFKGTEKESQQAREALSDASEALKRKSHEAPATTQQAAEQLRKLSAAIQDRSAGQQLADAYRLKQLLDKEIQTLDRGAQTNSKVPSQEMKQTALAASETLNQLKQVAEQEPTRGAFGPALRDALSSTNKADLDDKLKRLQQARDDQVRRRRAGEARDALGEVSRAFAASQPRTLQTAQQSDALKTGADESFNRGMAELDSLVQQLERNRALSPEDEAKQSRQALADLQAGVRNQMANSDSTEAILLRLQEALKAQTPLEAANLKALMDQLQRFSVENSEQLARRDEPPEITSIDPSRLPPAYRGRIQKYFQKLSEK